MTLLIKLSPLGNDGELTKKASYPWPEGTFLQGGKKGIVFSKKGNYTTAFVEGTTPDVSFFRGEGQTLEEAEKDAWEKHQKYVTCLEHEWDSYGYTNGAGFCKKCKKFGTNIFTGEQLNQYCDVCEVGTTWGYTYPLEHPQSETVIWGCRDHLNQMTEQYVQYLNTLNPDDLSEKEKMEIIMHKNHQESLKDQLLTEEELNVALTDILKNLGGKKEQ